MSRDDGRESGAYCLFSSRSLPMAVGLEVVAEVAEPRVLVRLPLCPTTVLGLCTGRGGILPVVGPPTEGAGIAEDGPTVLVLRSGRGLWGLRIDRLGVSVQDDRDVQDDGGPPLPEGFVARGTITHRGTTHAVLDPERTWTSLRSVIDRWYGDVLGNDPAAASTTTGAGPSSTATPARGIQRQRS